MARSRTNKQTGLTVAQMRFGKYLFELNGNATEAYKRAYPKSNLKGNALAVKAYELKRRLQESGWFKEVLDMAGLTEEFLAQKAAELLNAKETKFFASEGVIISEREVNDHTTQRAVLKLALEARKLLIQKQELEAKVETSNALTELLLNANRSRNEDETEE